MNISNESGDWWEQLKSDAAAVGDVNKPASLSSTMTGMPPSSNGIPMFAATTTTSTTTSTSTTKVKQHEPAIHYDRSRYTTPSSIAMKTSTLLGVGRGGGGDRPSSSERRPPLAPSSSSSSSSTLRRQQQQQQQRRPSRIRRSRQSLIANAAASTVSSTNKNQTTRRSNQYMSLNDDDDHHQEESQFDLDMMMMMNDDNISLKDNYCHPTTTTTTTSIHHHNAIRKELLLSSQFADVLVHCLDDISLPAHKNILAAASPILAQRIMASQSTTTTSTLRSSLNYSSSVFDWKVPYPAYVMRAVLSFIYLGPREPLHLRLMQVEPWTLYKVAHDWRLPSLIQALNDSNNGRIQRQRHIQESLCHPITDSRPTNNRSCLTLPWKQQDHQHEDHHVMQEEVHAHQPLPLTRQRNTPASTTYRSTAESSSASSSHIPLKPLVFYSMDDGANDDISLTAPSSSIPAWRSSASPKLQLKVSVSDEEEEEHGDDNAEKGKDDDYFNGEMPLGGGSSRIPPVSPSLRRQDSITSDLTSSTDRRDRFTQLSHKRLQEEEEEELQQQQQQQQQFLFRYDTSFSPAISSISCWNDLVDLIDPNPTSSLLMTMPPSAAALPASRVASKTGLVLMVPNNNNNMTQNRITTDDDDDDDDDSTNNNNAPSSSAKTTINNNTEVITMTTPSRNQNLFSNNNNNNNAVQNTISQQIPDRKESYHRKAVRFKNNSSVSLPQQSFPVSTTLDVKRRIERLDDINSVRQQQQRQQHRDGDNVDIDDSKLLLLSSLSSSLSSHHSAIQHREHNHDDCREQEELTNIRRRPTTSPSGLTFPRRRQKMPRARLRHLPTSTSTLAFATPNINSTITATTTTTTKMKKKKTKKKNFLRVNRESSILDNKEVISSGNSISKNQDNDDTHHDGSPAMIVSPWSIESSSSSSRETKPLLRRCSPSPRKQQSLPNLIIETYDHDGFPETTITKRNNTTVVTTTTNKLPARASQLINATTTSTTIPKDILLQQKEQEVQSPAASASTVVRARVRAANNNVDFISQRSYALSRWEQEQRRSQRDNNNNLLLQERSLALKTADDSRHVTNTTIAGQDDSNLATTTIVQTTTTTTCDSVVVADAEEEEEEESSFSVSVRCEDDVEVTLSNRSAYYYDETSHSATTLMRPKNYSCLDTSNLLSRRELIQKLRRAVICRKPAMIDQHHHHQQDRTSISWNDDDDRDLLSI